MNARLSLILVLALPPGLAAGADATESAIARLAQTGAVTCRPTLPFFCSNTHVACAGRTTVGTFPFTLRSTPARAWIESAADTSGIAEHYENGRLDRASDGSYLIVHPRDRAGYIKLLANGHYSFRHYVKDLGTMSHGHCH